MGGVDGWYGGDVIYVFLVVWFVESGVDSG